jgi:hypothetical protein
MQEVEKNLKEIKYIDMEEYFKAENFSALNSLRNGKFKEARERYKNLIRLISAHYNFRFEGRPLMHEVQRNLATV